MNKYFILLINYFIDLEDELETKMKFIIKLVFMFIDLIK